MGRRGWFLSLLVWALAACSGAAPASEDERPVALTTFTVLADMVATVADEHVRVESITKVGTEIHGYEPTPGDLRRASDADVIFDNGLELEAWFADFVGRLDVPHVVVTEGVEPIPIEGMSGTANPHAWMSPITAKTYVDNITAGLSSVAPEHSDAFEANAAAYKEELDAIHREMIQKLDRLPSAQRALVTCEGAFSYLARDADLAEAYIWPVNAEQQATPQQVASAIEFVRERSVPAVFCESTVSDKAMRQVASESGARFGGILFVDSLSEPDGPVPTYLDLLRYDVEMIVSTLLEGQDG